MQLMLDLDIAPLPKPITYNSNILLIGSCFTENMTERLQKAKFRSLANPNGILFNPLSVAQSLDDYIMHRQYAQHELFYLNELWNSWDHHTRFSHIGAVEALKSINQSLDEASNAVHTVSHIIITLGSAFQYYLVDNNRPVANNHRAPAQWFEKRLLDISIIIERLAETLDKLFAVNKDVQVIFTISPVRHIRDGVIDNNRSKARLIEAVHTLCNQYVHCVYFPAYEIVIDILRDYRYYDIDFVHPNFLATSFIWEQFAKACIEPTTQQLMQQVQEITTARAHRPRFPETEAHQKFKAGYITKINNLLKQHPSLNLSEELAYFNS